MIAIMFSTVNLLVKNTVISTCMIHDYVVRARDIYLVRQLCILFFFIASCKPALISTTLFIF